MDDLTERYDIKTAAAWFLGHATDLTEDIRQKLISLFERYGAKVRIVYLEAPRDVRDARNESRQRPVPGYVIERMLSHMVLPLPDEAQTVEWLYV